MSVFVKAWQNLTSDDSCMYIYFIYDKFIYACVCNDIAVGKFFVSFGLSSNVKKKSIIISKDFVTGNRIHTYSIFTK